jgi:hypothetical protein
MSRTTPYLRAQCQCCERIRARVRQGWGQTTGSPYGRARKTRCIRGHKYTEGSYYTDKKGGKHCRECQSLRARTEKERERKRIYAEGRRRAAGIPPRNWSTPKETPIKKGEILRLEFEPFKQWLIQMHLKLDREELIDKTGIHPRRLSYILYEAKGRDKVSIDTVDAALIKEGFTGLWELYPELYPDD